MLTAQYSFSQDYDYDFSHAEMTSSDPVAESQAMVPSPIYLRLPTLMREKATSRASSDDQDQVRTFFHLESMAE